MTVLNIPGRIDSWLGEVVLWERREQVWNYVLILFKGKKAQDSESWSAWRLMVGRIGSYRQAPVVGVVFIPPLRGR